MIALEIFLNGEKIAVAGAEDLEVLAATVQAGGKLGPLTIQEYWGEEEEDIEGVTENEEKKDFYLSLSASGLTSCGPDGIVEYPWWIQTRMLGVGDAVSINIVTANQADKHFIRTEEESSGFFNEQEMYEECKKWYFELRDKYENQEAK